MILAYPIESDLFMKSLNIDMAKVVSKKAIPLRRI